MTKQARETAPSHAGSVVATRSGLDGKLTVSPSGQIIRSTRDILFNRLNSVHTHVTKQVKPG